MVPVPGLEPVSACAASLSVEPSPPPTPRPNLLVQVLDSQVGRTIAAAVPITKGEVIIAERPLLVVPSLRALPRELRRLLRNGARELQAPIANFLNIYAYTNADADVRENVLTFCSYEVHAATLPPAPPPNNDTLPFPRIINIATRVSAWWNDQPRLVCQRPADGASFSDEELTRAQCCFALNAHEILESDTDIGTAAKSGAETEPAKRIWCTADVSLEPEPESTSIDTEIVGGKPATVAAPPPGPPAGGGTHALFLLGSRLTHVCGRPCSAYHYQNGYGCHRAVRDISVGEILTSCYLGARAACGRATRRRYLKDNYLFDCGCATCSEGTDVYRQLPCPHCGIERDRQTGLLVLTKSDWADRVPSSFAHDNELAEVPVVNDAVILSATDTQVVSETASNLLLRVDASSSTGWVRRNVATDVTFPDDSPEFASPSSSGITERSSCSSAAGGGGGGGGAATTAAAGDDVSSPGASCWRCCSCGGTFSDDEVDCRMTGPAPPPLQLKSPAALFEWETSLAEAAFNLAMDSDAGRFYDHTPSDLVETRRPLSRAVRLVLGDAHWVTAACEEVLLEALLEYACNLEHGSDGDDEGDQKGDAAEAALDDKICAEIWSLFSRLWSWFEEREFHAVWGIPEDLLQVMQKCPALADYIEADEHRGLRLREITEATLDRTIVSNTVYRSFAFAPILDALVRIDSMV